MATPQVVILPVPSREIVCSGMIGGMAKKKTGQKTSQPKTKPKAGRGGSSSDQGERLQKVLAAAGFGSRRDCEELIVEGRVEIDREIANELGVRVKADQKIRVDGVPVKVARKQYFMVNKPPGVVSTNRDPDGRARVIDLVNSDQRLFTVGRLDKSSEGLILVTNDGDFANELAHPRHGVEKTYIVKVMGVPTASDLQQLTDGVHLAEGFAKAASVKLRKKFRQGSELEIVLSEGRNREIRRLLARIGHKVLKLKRVALGPLKLGSLFAGDCRRLTVEELEALRRAVKPGKASKRRPRSKGQSGRQGSGIRKGMKQSAKARPKSKSAKRSGAKAQGREASKRPAMNRPTIGSIIGEDAPETTSTPERKRKPKPGKKAARDKAIGKKVVGKKGRGAKGKPAKGRAGKKRK